MKKSLVILTLALVAFAATFTSGLMGKYSASAQDSGVVMPKVGIYALDTNNTLFILKPGSTSFTRLVQVRGVTGTLIGMDFRVSDRQLYALTNSAVYTINLTNNLGAATRISSISPSFGGGIQSLMDFNPVLSAVRLIGSNDQNYALVNSNGGNLNVTAVQTAMTYPAGDVNAGADPNISCGAYTNNVNGATVTIFYGIDSNLNTFVTIPPATPGGSSATGGGQLQTIGNLVTPRGERVNFSPTGDFDILTINGNNILVGLSGQRLFTIDLRQINPNLQRGRTQNVVVRSIPLPGPSGFIDVAIPTF
jgi:uncharacterized protein DUF4394